MNAGTGLILNGGSSYGKTSLAKALQNRMESPTLVLGIDLFWMAMPSKQLDLERVEPQYYRWEVAGDPGREEFLIHPGPLLTRIMSGRTRSIAGFLELGFNVIADDVIWERAWLVETLRLLAPFRVYFIGVRCDDAVSAYREQVRRDRHIGWARGSGRIAHQDAMYDLWIDTSHESAGQCADRIKRAIDTGLEPKAMDEMRRRFNIDSALSQT